jgi:anti-sigma B factor antagonist
MNASLATSSLTCAATLIAMFTKATTTTPSKSHSTPFGLEQRELDQTTALVAVEGELDLMAAPRLKWMLVDALETGHTALIVDLSGAAFMDSTALGVLVGISRKLDSGGTLAIVCTKPNVLKIFEYSGMDGAFAIFGSVDDALAYTRGERDHD